MGASGFQLSAFSFQPFSFRGVSFRVSASAHDTCSGGPPLQEVAMQDFRNLHAWQKAHRLTLNVIAFSATLAYPKGIRSVTS